MAMGCRLSRFFGGAVADVVTAAYAGRALHLGLKRNSGLNGHFWGEVALGASIAAEFSLLAGENKSQIGPPLPQLLAK